MNLYLLSQDQNGGYDTYDSTVVAAESEEAARLFFPGTGGWGSGTWASRPDRVKVTLLGTATDGTLKGVICASFNAG